MQDIFDTLAPSSPQGGGDIFDQLSPDQPAASSNTGNVDMSTVAGATPGTPSPAQAAGVQKRPMSQMNAAQAVSHAFPHDLTTEQEQEDARRNHPVQTPELNYGQHALPRIAQGLQELSPGVTPTGALGVQDTGGGSNPMKGIADVTGGISEGLSGSVLPFPAAAGAVSPLRMAANTAAGVAGGYAGSRGAQAITKAAGGSADAQEAAANAGGLIGTMAGPLSYEAIRARIAQKNGVPVPPAPTKPAEAPALPEATQPGGPAPEPTPTPGGGPSAAGKSVNIGGGLHVPPGAQIGDDGKITLTAEHPEVSSLLDSVIQHTDAVRQAKDRLAQLPPNVLQQIREWVEQRGQRAAAAGNAAGANNAAHNDLALSQLLDNVVENSRDREFSYHQNLAPPTPEEQADIMRTFFPDVQKAAQAQAAAPAPEPIPTDPAALIARQQAQANSAAMADADTLDAAAKNMAAGIPPPKPPQPEGMDQGQITPKTVQHVAQAIQQAPPDQQAAMLNDAHEQLAKWMAEQGKVQGPDGQITVVKNPEQAQQLAAKWINDEMGRQQKAQEDAQKAKEKAANDAQKAQEKTQKDAQKQSEKQQKERDQNGQPPIEQRAKTLMDANPERNPVPLLQRQLGLSYSEAKDLADRVRQTAPIEAAPKVGGEGHEVVEESRGTVDKQIDALSAGTIKAVHIPAGSKYMPQIPDGMKAVDVKNGPGAGRFIYNPQQVRAATIKEAAKAGTHGDLLGHVNTKQEIAQSENPVVVQARDQDGTVIQDSAVDGANAGAVEAQKEALQERHPNATISVVHPAAALNERIEEGAKGDIFDEIQPDQPQEQPSARENQSHPAGEVKPAAAEPAKPAAQPGAGSGPATPEVAGGSEQQPIKEGDRVTYKTNKGKERPAKVVRISGKDAFIRDGDSTVRKPLAELKAVVDHGEAKILHTFTNHDQEIESTVTRRQDGKFVVKLRDLDAGEFVPTMHFYDNEADAVKKAKEWAAIKEEKPVVDGGLRGIKTDGSNAKEVAERISDDDRFYMVLKLQSDLTNDRTIWGGHREVVGEIIGKPRFAKAPKEVQLHMIEGWMEEREAAKKPQSLSGKGVEATKDAMRQANPASKRTEEQQRQDAEEDIRRNEDQMRQFLRYLTPEQVKQYLDANPEQRERVERLLREQEPTHAEPRKPETRSGADQEGGRKPESVHAGKGNPDTRTPRERLAGADGDETTLRTPARKLKARYRLVEAADLTPSHNPKTFEKNPAYPEGVQERTYDTSKEAQARVLDQAENYDPAYTVNTNPDAVNGPPIITPDGIVLGGNSRAMSTQLAYSYGAQGQGYKDALREHAEQFGFTADQVGKMDRPVLVREVEAPEDKDDLRRLGSELNESMTGALGVSEQAVSAGKNLSPETLRSIAAMMNENDSTLREVMAARGGELLRMLVGDRVIAERQRPKFTDKTGGLSEEGKTFIERALMGSVIDDPRLMDAAPKSVLNKLERALGAITAFATREDEWNILPAIRAAVGELATIQANESTVDLHLGQIGLFGGERNPVVDQLVRTLDSKPTEARKAFESFARDSDDNMPGQSRMFGAADAFDSFNNAFGSTLTAQEYLNGLVQSATADPGGDVEGDGEEGNAGVSESQTAEPTPGSGAGTSRSAAPGLREVEAERDAVEEGEPPATFTDHLYRLISDGQMPKDNRELKKITSEFDGEPASDARMKTAQEDLEAAIVRRARDIVTENRDEKPLHTFVKLQRLYESQPNLNVRTSSSIERQAYSTPAPLAYVAGLLAGVDTDAATYEPTGGNGMLLIGANPENVTANELDPYRAAALRAQGFEVTTNDATDNTDIAPDSQDAVVTNPPFGSLKGPDGKTVKVSVDGYKIGQIDHLIAARALDAMKADGRATLILGANRVTGGQNTDDRIFLNWLYSHYNVTHHFEVDGDLYNRQGAGWPVRVIAVNGRKASDKVAPEEGTIQRVDSWEGVYEQLNRGLEAQQRANNNRGAGGSVQRKHDTNEPRPLRESSGSSARGSHSGGSRSSAPASQRQSGEQSRPVRDSDRQSPAGLPVTDPAIRPSADDAQSNRLEQPRAERKAQPERPAKPTGDSRSTPKLDTGNEFQAAYTPSSSKKDEGILIPTNMRQPLEQAMLKLEDKVGNIDEFVREELGYDTIDEMHEALMGLQVDAIAGAIQQIKEGNGTIIADQTGIGKGRQAAAMIRWAERNGHIPVFITVKPQLFTDMHGDLNDIGSSDIDPFIVNVDEAVTLPNGEKAYKNNPNSHRRTLEQIRNTGELPSDRNAVFMTYSQINTDNLQRQVISSIAQKAVFILDESHSAGGDSNTGDFVKGILQSARGVTYLSATYAKRPDNMPLYFKTDIGKAIGDDDTLATAMAAGGLPLQTVVSNNLVKAGQMFRRERSYDGVDIHTKVATKQRAEHTKLADSVTEALRAIVKADKNFHQSYVADLKKKLKKEGKEAKSAGNKASSTVSHAEFSSVVHNFVRQMLLGLKADVAADEAIASIERGEKPIIAVENTMGSFLQEYANDHGIAVGESIEDFDYRTVLSRALERTRYVVITDEQGNKTRQHVELEDLDDEGREMYDEAEKLIGKLLIDLPVSPLDWMRMRIAKAGYSVKEITGRSLTVDYTDPDTPKLANMTAEEHDRVKTVHGFNNGQMDALILNVAGSTGISLHASERYTDQRQRHMIVAQPAQDINVFMQMLGRIHRTGQVRLPKYTILNTDLPAEKRPTALLSKKMKSLNANTSSNTESATSVKAVDMLNKYGDEKVHAFLNDNPDLADALGIEVSEEPSPDMARAVTGRLALMPVEVQRAFYEEVEQQYRDYIDYLDATNQNELEPKTFDYDAKELKTQVIFDGPDKNSPFGEDAVYGEYSIKAQAKPLTPEEVRGAINESLGGKTGEQKMQEMIAELDPQFKAYRAKLPEEGVQYGQSGLAQTIAKDFLRQNHIGSTLRIEINGEIFNAAVTDVKSNHKGTGNPYALSKFQVTLATNGEMRTIRVPATQLERITTSRLWEQPEDLFRVVTHEFRAQAKIVTGNLLAAYGEIGETRGTIINFTKSDGTVEQGILLPRRFEPSKAFRGDYRLKSAEQAARFLLKSQNPKVEEDGIASRDGNVSVVRDGRNLVILTPRSKARGAKYFLDHKLIDIVGDFVSKGAFMRATIPHGKEAEAIARIMDKSTLYVPEALGTEAQRYEDGSQAPGRPRPDASVGFMGTQYADQLLKEAAVAGKKFWDADVAPNMVKLGGGAKEAGAQIAHVLYPRLGANADAQDILSRARGRLESHLFALEHIDGGLEKFFDKMSREAQLAFIDRYKLGVGQPDPKLQQVEDMMRTIDARSLQAAQRYKPNLTAKEDHFRVIWRVIPGSQGQKAGGKSAQFSGSKRPWQGDKGFMKRATLDTISEGINAGGEPVTANPWKLFTLAQASIMKFVAAQQAWEAAKNLGMRKYVKRGQQAPDGWVKINDRIADVYFPEQALSVDIDALPVQKIGPKANKKEFIAKEDIETHKVMANPGSWYAEAGFARLLNNYLSEDKIRRSPVGSALLFAKNLTTAIELSLSPFHAIFESLEAMGSQFGLGVQRVWNNGIRLGEGAELTQGLKEIAGSIAAPYLVSRTGGNVLRYAENPAQFFQTDRGKAFVRRFPDAVGAMQELFNGGLTWGVQRDFRFDPQKSMMEAAKEGNYVGAVLRAVPWINSTLMKPLFEAYIPRLKWGLALGLYSEQLVENAEALANGDMTKTEIARKVVDTVENRFGEMNFNNIYWNNTFKSALQLAFRSVTWKLGNLRGAGSAIGPEMLNSFRDPLDAFRRDWNGNGNGSGNNGGSGGGGSNGRGSMFHPANARKYVPKVGMNQGWLLGMAFTTAVIGTVIAKFMTHRWPWEMAAEDREEGYSFPGAIALEVMHPRTGRFNDYTGKPERINLPTGLRDFEHLWRDPAGYAKSSMSGFASKTIDTLENRDAFKNYVYDPNAAEYQKLAEIFAYNAPKPISLQNLTSKYGPQDATSKGLRAVGLGNASAALDYSPAEQKMRSMRQHEPMTPEQVKERDQEHMHPTRKQLHRALKANDVPYVERLFKGLSYTDAREVYNSPDTTDHERSLLHRLMKEKRQNHLKGR